MKLAEENLDEPHLDSEKALDLAVRFGRHDLFTVK